MSRSYSYTIDGIVLKRINFGETDRIVTFFTRELGKLTALAKGVRKISSKRAASLEVGTSVHAMITRGKGMDIITQTVILDSFSAAKTDLKSCTKLYQILEILDLLTRENQELNDVYDVAIETLTYLKSSEIKRQYLLKQIKTITELLGFTPPEDMSELALKNYIETIADRKLKTKDFLLPK